MGRLATPDERDQICTMLARTILFGSCHCKAVRFHFQRPTAIDLLDCNCSICSRTSFLHLIVPHRDFVLEQGEDALASYRFGTGAANLPFCMHCGVKTFYQPRSHPEAWSINWHCAHDREAIEARIVPFDGRNWDEARSRL